MAERKVIRVKKDYYRDGYYSVHRTSYRNGRMSSDIMVDHFRKKRDAQVLANHLRKKRRT